MRKILLGSAIAVLMLSTNSFTGDSVEGRVGARFTGVFSDSGIDKNGDGYFEQLTISGEVETDSCAGAVVLGYLSGQNGNAITGRPYMDYTAHLGRAELVSESGRTVFHIFFSGQDIWASKTDGPYKAELWLGCEDSSTKVADTIYVTSAYSHTAFRETMTEQEVGVLFGMDPLELAGIIALVVLLILLLWRIFRGRASQAS